MKLTNISSAERRRRSDRGVTIFGTLALGVTAVASRAARLRWPLMDPARAVRSLTERGCGASPRSGRPRPRRHARLSHDARALADVVRELVALEFLTPQGRQRYGATAAATPWRRKTGGAIRR
jgi:hypothetical protein